jgi:hypothetical protein
MIADRCESYRRVIEGIDLIILSGEIPFNNKYTLK